jgi:hypothetical protein
MKTYTDLTSELQLESITSVLFKLARLSADGRAIKQSVKKGSLSPIEKRLIRKALGRKVGPLFKLI